MMVTPTMIRAMGLTGTARRAVRPYLGAPVWVLAIAAKSGVPGLQQVRRVLGIAEPPDATAARNRRIVEMRAVSAKLVVIAAEVGLSVERVRQILKGLR